MPLADVQINSSLIACCVVDVHAAPSKTFFIHLIPQARRATKKADARSTGDAIDVW